MATVKLIGVDDATADGYGGAGYQFLGRFQAVASGSMTEFKVKCDANGTIAYAVYADSSGSPSTRLAQQATPQAVVSGWNTLTIASVSLTSGSYYWLAVYIATGSIGYITSGGTRKYKSAASTFPDPFDNTGFAGDTLLLFMAGWGVAIRTLYPSGIEQPIVLGTPAVSKLQKIISPTGIEQLIALGTPTLTKRTAVSPDYPDWTESMQLTGTEIYLPVNIQGVSVTVPMNILAQEVDITIDITAQSVGVYLQPEWAAKEGQDKNFFAAATNVGYGNGATATYTVPAGKTLFISGISGQIEADLAANYDHHLYCLIWVRNVTTSTFKALVGGLGGAFLTFPKPIVIPAGQQVEFLVANKSNISSNIAVTAWGYEV